MVYVFVGVVAGLAQLAGWALAAVCVSILAVMSVQSLVDSERRTRLWLRMRGRARRVELAAVEAAEDEPAFDPDRIRRSVRLIVEVIDAIWTGRRSAPAAQREDQLLIGAWASSRQARLGVGVRIDGAPQVDLLRIVNRAGQREDSVVARVRIAALRPSHLPPRKVFMQERWTLARVGGEWRLASVAGDPLGGPVLSAPLITSPASDQQRLQEASLSELTDRSAMHEDPAGLVDETLPPSLRLLDLSLADDRFSPILLASAISHVLDTWEEASHGSSDPLREVGTPAAIDVLLHPHGLQQRRFVVDPALDRWEVLELQTRTHPPSLVLAIHLTSASYEADEQHVTGNDLDRRSLSLTWTFELQDDDDQPSHWRLAAASER